WASPARSPTACCSWTTGASSRTPHPSRSSPDPHRRAAGSSCRACCSTETQSPPTSPQHQRRTVMLHRTRTAAALAALAAGALLLTACSGGDSGSAGAEAPAVASSTDFPEGSTMARLAEAGTVTIGTKFDQPLFGLKG